MFYSPINMTVFIFEEEIEVSRYFSRDVSNCFDLLVDSCSDGTAIRINFFLFFVALSFNKNKNFVSNFSLVPRYIFINVIVPSGNCCLKTVNHFESLEFSLIEDFFNSFVSVLKSFSVAYDF